MRAASWAASARCPPEGPLGLRPARARSSRSRAVSAIDAGGLEGYFQQALQQQPGPSAANAAADAAAEAAAAAAAAAEAAAAIAAAAQASADAAAAAAAAAAPPPVLDLGGLDLAALGAAAHAAVDALAAALPGPLAALAATIGGDAADLLGLSPSLAGAARLAAIWYLLFSRPAPLPALLDYYALAPLSAAARAGLSQADFTLRDRLGSGNYGQVYEGLRNRRGEAGPERGGRGALDAEQKTRRVVLKKTNADAAGIRRNFIGAGTIARGAQESGEVEAYLHARLALHPRVARRLAAYQGQFEADAPAGAFTLGSRWLVWRFESDATLADALAGGLGSPFPGCAAPLVLGAARAEALGAADPARRDAATVRELARQLLAALELLHSLGVVHRDVKVREGGRTRARPVHLFLVDLSF
jgi:hypothetical protein